MSHAHGSYVGAQGASSESAAAATHPTIQSERVAIESS
jgi:hypothetical protein